MSCSRSGSRNGPPRRRRSGSKTSCAAKAISRAEPLRRLGGAGVAGALSKPAPRSGSEPFRLPEAAVGILLILPAILLLLSLTLYPVLYGVWISFFNKHSFFPQQTFIGFDNYIFLLRDPEFWASVWRGTVYALSTIVLQIILGVAAALRSEERRVGNECSASWEP